MRLKKLFCGPLHKACRFLVEPTVFASLIGSITVIVSAYYAVEEISATQEKMQVANSRLKDKEVYDSLKARISVSIERIEPVPNYKATNSKHKESEEPAVSSSANGIKGRLALKIGYCVNNFSDTEMFFYLPSVFISEGQPFENTPETNKIGIIRKNGKECSETTVLVPKNIMPYYSEEPDLHLYLSLKAAPEFRLIKYLYNERTQEEQEELVELFSYTMIVRQSIPFQRILELNN